MTRVLAADVVERWDDCTGDSFEADDALDAAMERLRRHLDGDAATRAREGGRDG